MVQKHTFSPLWKASTYSSMLHGEANSTSVAGDVPCPATTGDSGGLCTDSSAPTRLDLAAHLVPPWLLD